MNTEYARKADSVNDALREAIGLLEMRARHDEREALWEPAVVAREFVGRARAALAAPMAAPEPRLLLVAREALLEAVPEYGDVGTRDVDVARKRDAVAKAVEAIDAALATRRTSPQAAPNLEAIIRAAKAADSHWREFGPECEFDRVMLMLEIALAQLTSSTSGARSLTTAR